MRNHNWANRRALHLKQNQSERDQLGTSVRRIEYLEKYTNLIGIDVNFFFSVKHVVNVYS